MDSKPPFTEGRNLYTFLQRVTFINLEKNIDKIQLYKIAF